MFGPQRGPRDVSAAPGLSPAAFEPVRRRGRRPPGAGRTLARRRRADGPSAARGATSGSWPSAAALSTVVPARRSRGARARCPSGVLGDLAGGVPAIVSPPNMRRVALGRSAALRDADVVRTAARIHPLVIDDVLPVALVQTTP